MVELIGWFYETIISVLALYKVVALAGVESVAVAFGVYFSVSMAVDVTVAVAIGFYCFWCCYPYTLRDLVTKQMLSIS